MNAKLKKGNDQAALAMAGKRQKDDRVILQSKASKSASLSPSLAVRIHFVFLLLTLKPSSPSPSPGPSESKSFRDEQFFLSSVASNQYVEKGSPLLSPLLSNF